MFVISEGQVIVSMSVSKYKVFVWVRFDGRNSLIRIHIFFGLATAPDWLFRSQVRVLPRWSVALRGFAQPYMFSNIHRIWILKLSGVKCHVVASLIIYYHWSTFRNRLWCAFFLLESVYLYSEKSEQISHIVLRNNVKHYVPMKNT